jgi:branched-chain amino acid transport system ATP-binding protein
MSLLEVQEVEVFYGQAQALWGVSFEADKGRLVALIGANGAGKTTTLKAVTGLVEITAGRISYDGRVISGKPVHQVVDLGISLVPEGRQLFPNMTSEENLTVGSYLKRAKAKRTEKLDWVYSLFPRLEERRHQSAGTMSGGEQQMVAIARGLMQDPKLLMLDEPSLGLAPVLVQEIFKNIKKLHRQGLTMLLVEQNVHMALQVADFAYALENGRVLMSGQGQEMAADPKVKEVYLGL